MGSILSHGGYPWREGSQPRCEDGVGGMGSTLRACKLCLGRCGLYTEPGWIYGVGGTSPALSRASRVAWDVWALYLSTLAVWCRSYGLCAVPTGCMVWDIWTPHHTQHEGGKGSVLCPWGVWCGMYGLHTMHNTREVWALCCTCWVHGVGGTDSTPRTRCWSYSLCAVPMGCMVWDIWTPHHVGDVGAAGSMLCPLGAWCGMYGLHTTHKLLEMRAPCCVRWVYGAGAMGSTPPTSCWRCGLRAVPIGSMA